MVVCGDMLVAIGAIDRFVALSSVFPLGNFIFVVLPFWVSLRSVFPLAHPHCL